MKALVVTAGHELELREIPDPRPGLYEALVRIRACAICSTTDRELIKGTQPYHKQYPCVLGHESVGEVVELGAKVRSFRIGQLVTRPAAIWPGERLDGLASAWGGFAERGIVRDRRAMEADGDRSLSGDNTALRQNAVPGRPDIVKATLAISLGETSSWLRRVGNVAGRHVCIAGTGIAGLSLAIWSKLGGAASVTVLGRRDGRLDLARELGADHVVNVREAEDVAGAVKELTGGADIFLEAVGQKDQLRIGLRSLRQGKGTIAIYGVVPGGKYDLEWSYVPADVRIMRPPAEEHLTYAWALDLLERGVVPAGRLLTHRWPLARYAEAFAEIEAGRVVKGIIEMANSGDRH